MGAFDRLQEAGKALLAAVAAAVGSVLVTTAADPDGSISNIQLPNTKDEWVAFGSAVVLTYLAAYFKRNFPSVPKAEDDLKLAEKRVRAGKQAA